MGGIGVVAIGDNVYSMAHRGDRKLGWAAPSRLGKAWTVLRAYPRDGRQGYTKAGGDVPVGMPIVEQRDDGSKGTGRNMLHDGSVCWWGLGLIGRGLYML